MPEEKLSKKKAIVPIKKEEPETAKRKEPSILAPYSPSEVWQDLDRAFERFRRDFETLMLPPERFLGRTLPRMPAIEGGFPRVDLEDRGKDFLLTAEMPGFKKEDVNIQIAEDSVEIKAESCWKYDDKTKNYIHKERAVQSFYRRIDLPEAIKTDEAEANLKDGVLEIVMPKKAPKSKKKISVK